MHILLADGLAVFTRLKSCLTVLRDEASFRVVLIGNMLPRRVPLAPPRRSLPLDGRYDVKSDSELHDRIECRHRNTCTAAATAASNSAHLMKQAQSMSLLISLELTGRGILISLLSSRIAKTSCSVC